MNDAMSQKEEQARLTINEMLIYMLLNVNQRKQLKGCKILQLFFTNIEKNEPLNSLLPLSLTKRMQRMVDGSTPLFHPKGTKAY